MQVLVTREDFYGNTEEIVINVRNFQEAEEWAAFYPKSYYSAPRYYQAKAVEVVTNKPKNVYHWEMIVGKLPENVRLYRVWQDTILLLITSIYYQNPHRVKYGFADLTVGDAAMRSHFEPVLEPTLAVLLDRLLQRLEEQRTNK